VSGVKLFTERDLKRLAGHRRFERGQALVDALDGLDEDEFSLWSYVEDGDEYVAIVHHRAGRLTADATAQTDGQVCFASTQLRSALATCPTERGRRLGLSGTGLSI